MIAVKFIPHFFIFEIIMILIIFLKNNYFFIITKVYFSTFNREKNAFFIFKLFIFWANKFLKTFYLFLCLSLSLLKLDFF
jgi:hypothetical protein